MKLERIQRVVSAKLGALPLQEKGGTFRPAGVKRETKIGEIPEHTGYTESQVCAELTVKLNATGALGIEQLSDVGEDTLTIYTSSGKEYYMPNAWVTEPGKLGDAEMEITYNSATSNRIQ